jgi:YD repeat-containing protein
VESLSPATNTLRLAFDCQYNLAKHRRRIDNGDGTLWAIKYDELGQVVVGKKCWLL